MRSRRFPLWTLLGVVLVVALLVGSGVFSSTPPTNAQRAASIESVIRCPSCEDLSVAASSAPTAVTVRATVRQLVDHGLTDRQIEDYLVARYGSAIVLDPPASGWSSLVWVLPIVGGSWPRWCSWWSWCAGAVGVTPPSTTTSSTGRPTRSRSRSGGGSSPSHWPTPTPSTWPGT